MKDSENKHIISILNHEKFKPAEKTEKKSQELHSGLCDVNGCTNEATQELIIMLRVHAHHPAGATNRVCVVCEEHKFLKLKDICDENGWTKLCTELLLNDRQMPKKKYSYVKFNPLKKSMKLI